MGIFDGIVHQVQSAVSSARQSIGGLNHKLGNSLSPTFQSNIGEQTRALGNLGNALETGIGHIIDNTIGPAMNHIAEFIGGGIGRSQSLKDAIKNAAEAGAVYLLGDIAGGAGAGSGGGAGAGGGAEGGAAGGAGGGGVGASSLGGTAAVSTGAASTAVSGAGNAGNTGAATATGAAGTAVATSGGAAAAGDLNSTLDAKAIIAEIASVIQEVEGAIKGFIQPIADTVNEVNTGLIQPITGPINSIVQESKALHDFVTQDLHDGILGILKIPGDLADALNSVDASFTRALTSLQALQVDALNSALKTSGPDIGLTGSTKVAQGIADALPGEAGSWKAPSRDKLSDSADYLEWIATSEKNLTELTSSDHWYDRIWTGLYTLLDSFEALSANNAPFRKATEEAVNRVHPWTLLEPADVLAAFKRGLLDPTTAASELAGAGLNPSRIRVLMDLQRQLPGLADFLDWKKRQLLTDDELTAALAALGIADEDIARYKGANITLPDSGQALAWWQRGLLQESALDQLLTAAGYDPALVDVIKQGSTLLPQLADWMRAYDRELALSENEGANLAADNPPQAFLDEAHRLGVSLADASVLWANHLQLLPPPLAVTSYFKGYINRPQLYAFLRAASITRDQADMYIDALRPQIPVRSIPALVKLGIIDESTAVQHLKGLGFDDVQVDWLLKLAEASSRGAAGPTASTIHKDVQATTLALYNGGTITRDQAVAALTGAGLTADAVTAMLNLEDVKSTAAAHKLEVETVLAQVEGGALTPDGAVAALTKYGFNDRELALASARINRASRHRVKVPAEGIILSMARHGILNSADSKSALVLNGYSGNWADKLLALEVEEHGPLPNAG